MANYPKSSTAAVCGGHAGNPDSRLLRSCCGFSLIELLVVVAILAVLSSLLLSSIGTVRQAAKMSACMSNQRQIGLGMLAWSTDFNGQLPPAWKHHWQHGTPIGWATMLCQDDYLIDVKDWKATSRLLLCPAGRVRPLYNSWRFWDYNVATPLLGVQSKPNGSVATGFARVTQLSEIRRPASVVLLCDVESANPWWTCGTDAPAWSWCRWAAPHGGKGVFLMADLRVTTHRYSGALDANQGAMEVDRWDVTVAAAAADPPGQLIWSRQQLGLNPTW